MNSMHALDLDLNLLSALDAMFRERSVTKAAQSLGMTQSAMSHALNRLRSTFDDQLFVKVADAMVPTRKGETLRQPVVDVMSTVRRQILAEASFDPRTARRTFTLCVSDMGELVVLPPLLQRFSKEAPDCSVRAQRVPNEQIEGLLAAGDADLAIGSIRTVPKGLYQQRLYLHTFVTIVSPRNKEVGAKISLEQFERMPHIAVALTGGGTPYDQALEEQGVKRLVKVTTPHFLMVPLLMERHPELIATVPLELANVFSKYGVVRAIEPPVPLPAFAINQHWHPRFHHDPAVIWLRELMKRTFERYPEIVLEDAVPKANVGGGAKQRRTRQGGHEPHSRHGLTPLRKQRG
jgi:DNA-binding transcriptional LysR family regulator